MVPLDVQLSVAAPRNGMFLAAGEQATIAIHLVDRCKRPVAPADLTTLSLYLSGPRAPMKTRTAVKLLNAVTDRNAADRQHHYINLRAPAFLDANQKNLAATSTGFTFTTAPVTNEEQGTYTVGLWAVSKDLKDQQLVTVDLQIGTATVETFTTGDAKTSSCYACHQGPVSGKTYMAHIIPGFSPFGNYALDMAPVLNCKLCHNNDGYSPNTLVTKVHAVHRGASLLNPGKGHPEYGAPADSSIAEFVNVEYPDFPNGERDCVKCHSTDSYLKNPSRMACGACHDNVYFDTGVLDPPRKPGQAVQGHPVCRRRRQRLRLRSGLRRLRPDDQLRRHDRHLRAQDAPQAERRRDVPGVPHARRRRQRHLAHRRPTRGLSAHAHRRRQDHRRHHLRHDRRRRPDEADLLPGGRCPGGQVQAGDQGRADEDADGQG